ncbi:MAG: hypothetical protein ACPIOQ_78800, partial [Promethearchaeia archaeon]
AAASAGDEGGLRRAPRSRALKHDQVPACSLAVRCDADGDHSAGLGEAEGTEHGAAAPNNQQQ